VKFFHNPPFLQWNHLAVVVSGGMRSFGMAEQACQAGIGKESVIRSQLALMPDKGMAGSTISPMGYVNMWILCRQSVAPMT
jgi:hypothetical protein